MLILLLLFIAWCVVDAVSVHVTYALVVLMLSVVTVLMFSVVTVIVDVLLMSL